MRTTSPPTVIDRASPGVLYTPDSAVVEAVAAPFAAGRIRLQTSSGPGHRADLPADPRHS